MRRLMRPEFSAPRTVSSPAGGELQRYRPWVEVSALVRVSVAGWDVAETAWVHWAVPVKDGRADLEGTVVFDPGRRAAAPGEPAAELRAGESALDEEEAVRVCEALAERWRPRLHFHNQLRLASRLDEPPDAFRRRCLALLAPVLRNVDSSRRKGEFARLAASIESRELRAGELHVLRWRVGVGWYPSGIEPAAAPEDPMMLGSQGQGR